jgi:predicted metal-dependent HD superfamily phosphohydrolase
MSAMLQRWRETVASTGAADALIDAEFEHVLTGYREPGRHYHDVRHVAALLALTDAHATAFVDRASVDLAIFYHDAVYDPRRADNEEKSAALAREGLTRLGCGAAQVAKVERCVLATRHGSPDAAAADATDLDLARFLDFDLAVLAAAPAMYDAYAAAIRRDYAHVPEAAYRVGRGRVLRTFLDQPRIYRVPMLHEQWEARARANLARELESLQ